MLVNRKHSMSGRETKSYCCSYNSIVMTKFTSTQPDNQLIIRDNTPTPTAGLAPLCNAGGKNSRPPGHTASVSSTGSAVGTHEPQKV